jgi:hypothetical protein
MVPWCCAVFFSDSHFLLLFSSGGVIADEEAKQKTLQMAMELATLKAGEFYLLYINHLYR